MKILYLASVRIPSEKASSLAIVRQCQAFVNIGHQLELLLPNRSSSTPETIENVYGINPNFIKKEFPSVFLYSFGKLGYYVMLSIETLKFFLYFSKKKADYDLIYSRDHFLLLPFVLMGYSNRCFLELHVKQTDFITRYVCRRINKIIVISPRLQEYYKNVTNREDIQIEPSGVDMEQFNSSKSVLSIKESLLLPSKKIIFGYIGKYMTMGESKGVNEIVEAFSVAYKQNNNIHLLIVGVEDYEKKHLEFVIRESGLMSGSYTILSLIQKHFFEYLIASDVLLMNYPNTDHYANYMSPTKLFAYLASGKVIISSDLPSIRSVVSEREVVFVPPDNILKYSQAIIYAVENLDNLNVSKNTRINLARKFEWKKRAERILKI